jgi:diadenosine tetraphosphate (Ap4A) HIT family hydrolase
VKQRQYPVGQRVSVPDHLPEPDIHQAHVPCPFCPPPADHVLIERPVAFVKRDVYPLTKGHALVISRRHVATFFETTTEERQAMLELLDEAKAMLDREHQPDGYNIGINNGAAAGQTVMHVHLHIIPRYLGDRSDPRGGIRWIFPEKAAYWTKK